ncbi:MAG: UDP-N-acetylglucosamine 4,6-dehydratase (inverting) [Bacteroidota bacterium]|nr:UDP-N-acetylglucosamine 4,6-dehydratase (inverting) [Candidatus Kapabacteria bacterium]MDW8221177.1 UDP-N-acetylglucosamine 4,6-dehydratase (inverting) [Bacteroidota bacterium]
MLKYTSVLVTGGTGSFGKAFIKRVLTRYPEVERVVVFSRDELKQFEMAQEFSIEQYPQLRYFIGDVRDEDRLHRAFENIDVVVHAAALKQVPTAEYNPMECIKTNVIGAENVINAALKSGVRRVVALSTDKAAAPINLYGASKLCSDKLFVAANNFRGNRDITFAVVRYGNVIGSRGSVMPFFLKRRHEGVLPITHPDMTRFHISLDEGVDMVLYAISHMWGGEIFVPKIPSYRILDVAEAIAPSCKHEIIGIRPGEKLHEEMITEMDSFNTLELEHYYVIAPSMPLWAHDAYCQAFRGTKVPQGFRYSSGTNTHFMTVEEIRAAIRQHIDPEFQPL